MDRLGTWKVLRRLLRRRQRNVRFNDDRHLGTTKIRWRNKTFVNFSPHIFTSSVWPGANEDVHFYVLETLLIREMRDFHQIWM